MGNKGAKLPTKDQTVRYLRKDFNSPRKRSTLDIETTTPESSPRYRITIKDRGLRTQSEEIKNKRRSREIIESWLESYPESQIIVFEKTNL
jgi:hypothetical protein